MNGAGAGLLKKGKQLKPFLFNFFKVYHLSIKKLVYPLQNCALHLKKNDICLPSYFHEK